MTDIPINSYDSVSQVPFLEVTEFKHVHCLYRHDRKLTQFLRARTMPRLSRAFTHPGVEYGGGTHICDKAWRPTDHILFFQDGTACIVANNGVGVYTYRPSSNSWWQKREQRRKWLEVLAQRCADLEVLPMLDYLLTHRGLESYERAFIQLRKLLWEANSEYCRNVRYAAQPVDKLYSVRGQIHEILCKELGWDPGRWMRYSVITQFP